jgi:16S rRNA G966 N2-methylase RsmD
MNILAPRLDGCRWLDLCSGSGVMACEALQHGAQLVVAVENHASTARICSKNLQTVSDSLADEASNQSDSPRRGALAATGLDRTSFRSGLLRSPLRR